jgi:hypothetical protein
MRTIGIDLAVKASHKAIVMNAEGEFVTPVLSSQARWTRASKWWPEHEKASSRTIPCKR